MRYEVQRNLPCSDWEKIEVHDDWQAIEVHDDLGEATDAYNSYCALYSEKLDVRLFDSESNEVVAETRAR